MLPAGFPWTTNPPNTLSIKSVYVFIHWPWWPRVGHDSIRKGRLPDSHLATHRWLPITSSPRAVAAPLTSLPDLTFSVLPLSTCFHLATKHSWTKHCLGRTPAQSKYLKFIKWIRHFLLCFQITVFSQLDRTDTFFNLDAIFSSCYSFLSKTSHTDKEGKGLSKCCP